MGSPFKQNTEITNSTMGASLNSFEQTDNPSQIIGNFVVHDFDVSWNGAIITKEVAQENMHLLVGQYICCKYYSKEENCGEDALGSHEATTCINRDTGEEMASTNTTPIGTITDVWIGNNEEGKEVLNCKAILWVDKFYNCLSFLNEMINNGVNVPCSVEYGYKNYFMKDGVRYDQSPINYNALCILNPIDRGNIKAVLPAYDCSKFTGYSFNEVIEKDLQQQQENNMKDGGTQMENVFVKAFNASLGETRDAIMQALSDTLTATEFNSAWFSMYGIDTDNGTITYESYDEESGWKTYQINFSYNAEEGKYIIDLESKHEMEVETKLVAKNELDSLNARVADLEGQVSTLEGEKVSLNETITSLNEKVSTFGTDKVELVDQITALNAQIDELKPYKDKVVEAEFNEKLQVARNSYKGKFESVNAIDSFETEEVQGLIRDTLSEDKQISLNARVELSDMLLDKLATNKIVTAPTQIREVCGKKINNLIPSSSAKANEEKFGF